jgi:N-acetylglucosamine-6-phosphate deacetylase
VTSLLPTLSSLLPIRYSLEMILDNIRAIREAQQEDSGSEILGIHMEGPFLSSDDIARGSQLVFNMRDPSIEELNSMISASDGTIRKMTIAPELAGSLDVIREMSRHGIVPCAGHSTASYEKTLKAVKAGLRCATHTFNGMLPFHHRRPGLIGAVLTCDDINAELIADGQHVSATAMKILMRCKGPKCTHLVTDNTVWAGLPDGNYQDGDREVIKKDQKAWVEGGTLIGSVVSMNRSVANMVRLVGCTLIEAVRMASLTPARLIKCDHRKGSIEPGKDADLVILDQKMKVCLTMVKGRIVFRNIA